LAQRLLSSNHFKFRFRRISIEASLVQSTVGFYWIPSRFVAPVNFFSPILIFDLGCFVAEAGVQTEGLNKTNYPIVFISIKENTSQIS